MIRNGLALAIPILLAILAASPAHAAQCAENRDFYQSLPTVIGREDATSSFGYALKCDTVFVRKGVTTVIHAGAMLYFAKPTLYSTIRVEGTLIIKGSKNAYVYLSGSLDSNKTGGREPGARPWGGLEIAESGRLEMEYAGVMRAPTPITTFTNQVRIRNSFFKGSSGIILPDGNLMPLEVTWHAVNDLDLAKKSSDRKPIVMSRDPEKPAGGLSKEEKAALLAKKEGFWTWPKAAGGAAAVAVVAVGAIYFSNGMDSPNPKTPVSPTEKKETRENIKDVPLPN